MSKKKDFIYKAYYEGGIEALVKFIRDNLRYPKEAKDNGIQGVVKLQFDVDYKGKVHHVKVISGLGYGCDEEAIRITELLKYKVPKTYKLKVGFKKKLNIHFKLKKIKKKVAAPKSKKPTYQYTITSKPQESSSGYTYTIKI